MAFMTEEIYKRQKKIIVTVYVAQNGKLFTSRLDTGILWFWSNPAAAMNAGWQQGHAYGIENLSLRLNHPLFFSPRLNFVGNLIIVK